MKEKFDEILKIFPSNEKIITAAEAKLLVVILHIQQIGLPLLSVQEQVHMVRCTNFLLFL